MMRTTVILFLIVASVLTFLVWMVAHCSLGGTSSICTARDPLGRTGTDFIFPRRP